MNIYEIKYLNKMIKIIRDYITNKSVNFYNTVGELEGALDASEINDPELIKEWYDLWTPLEIRRATQGNDVDRIQAIEELVALEEYLLKKVKVSLNSSNLENILSVRVIGDNWFMCPYCQDAWKDPIENDILTCPNCYVSLIKPKKNSLN